MTPIILFSTMLFVPPGTTPAVQSLPSEIVLVSASYSDHPGEKWGGTLSFATRLAAPQSCYSYTSIDLGLTRVSGKVTWSESTRTGGACQIPQLSTTKFSAFILGTGGMTIVNASALASGSAGVLLVYQLSPKWLTKISATASIPLWIDYQNSNTTGKTARVGGGFAWGK